MVRVHPRRVSAAERVERTFGVVHPLVRTITRKESQ
jgi:hypothetical protein